MGLLETTSVAKLIQRSGGLLATPERITDRPYWLGHVPFAMWLVEASRPETLVELGTETGVSFCAFCQAAKNAQVALKAFAVDTWEGDLHTGTYGDELFEDVRSFVEARYGHIARLMRMSFDDAASHFEAASIDLLHIDGCHTYEAVKHDFERWLPKLSSRAIVLFHDISVREEHFGVWRLWEEVSHAYPSCAFTHSNGLGVLLIGSEVPDEVQEVLGLSGSDEFGGKMMLKLFETIGSGLITRVAAQSRATEVALLNDRLKRTDEALAAAQDVAYARTNELAVVGNQLTRTDAALAEAQGLAVARAAELAAVSEQLARTDAALAEAQGLAAAGVNELLAVTDQLRRTDAALGVAQALAYEREAELTKLRRSIAGR